MLNFQSIVDESFFEKNLFKEANEKKRFINNKENLLDLADKLEKVSFFSLRNWTNRQLNTTEEIKKEEKALKKAKLKEEAIRLRNRRIQQEAENARLLSGEERSIGNFIGKHKYPLALGTAGLGTIALAKSFKKSNSNENQKEQTRRLAQKYYLEGYRRGTGFVRTKARE